MNQYEVTYLTKYNTWNTIKVEADSKLEAEQIARENPSCKEVKECRQLNILTSKSTLTFKS